MTDEVARVAAIPDRAERLREATKAVSDAQRSMAALTQLRRELIQELHDEGWTFAEIAEAAGLSRGRVHQVQHQGPRPEGAFFGTSPITVALPVRTSSDRPSGVIALEDSTSAKRLQGFLASLSFTVATMQIPPDGMWTPTHDTVAICGPKSSPVTAQAIEADPVLSFKPDDSGRWVILDRTTGQVFTSPIDDGETNADIAYLARLPYADGSLIVIAGVHALGSLGAVEYLRENLATLWNEVGNDPFSMIVASRVDGTTVQEVHATWGPKRHV